MATLRDVESVTLDRVFAEGWDPKAVIVDPWSGLSHKAIVGPGTTDLTSSVSLAPTWVGRHRRRLDAYRVLAAYMANVARAFLPSGTDSVRKLEHREYGDPGVLVDQVVSALLGEDQEIVVAHADEELTRPEEPVDPGEDATEAQRAAFAEETAAFAEATEEYERAVEEQTRARERQEFMDEWAEAEKFPLALTETERDSVGLGDGVYLVSWSNEKKRVRLTMYDPGFYFPVLGDDIDFPNRVHLAWEFEEENGKKFVRRITFERKKFENDGSKRYPWQESDEEESRYTCVMTDASWPFDDLGDRRVDDFDISKARIAENSDGEKLVDFDLGIDFIPIVHIPNTISRKYHFGSSVITRVAQIFDDIANADTDLEQAASIVGAPPISVEGQAPPTSSQVASYGPGTLLFGGKLSVLDTSNSLDALLKYLAQLHDRLSVNTRFPAELMGRVKASEIEAGIIMLLSFGPLRSLMREMRLVRTDKYPLLFRFVQRLSMIGGVLPPGPDMRVELRFGSYLPNDISYIVEIVLKLLEKKGISRSSALRWLADIGVPLNDDLEAELRSIEREDFEGARELADAVNDEEPARRYLGLGEGEETEEEEEAPEGPEPAPAPGPGVPPEEVPEPA